MGTVWHVLRSRGFREGVVLAAIALVSLSGLGQETGTGMLARMAAWEKREIQRLERRASHRRRIRIARRRRAERQRASLGR